MKTKLSGVIYSVRPGRKVIKLFPCSTQLSTKFQLFIKNYCRVKKSLALRLSVVVFIMLIKNCWHFNIYEQENVCAQLS